MERREEKIDWLIVFLYIVFIVFGWLNIYASSTKDVDASMFNIDSNSGRQFIFMVASVLIGLTINSLNTKLIEFFSYFAYGGTILLLLLVLIVGHKVNGARSWFNIGPFGIQPAEFAKVTTTMALAQYMSSIHFNIRRMSSQLIVGGIIGLPVFLILLQPDAGTALVFSVFLLVFFREGLSYIYLVLIFLVVLFSILAIRVNNVLVIISIVALTFSSCYFIFKLKHILAHVVIGLSLIFLVSSVSYVIDNVLKPHQRERIYGLFEQDNYTREHNWNTTQSKIAIGSGGFMGKGFMKGTQTKYDFVPQQTTDFIFCTVGEEHGWLGSVIFLVLMWVFLAQIIYVSENAKSSYARVFGYSTAAIIFFHVAVNISMTIGLAPVIGIPLPFISYGGSSLISFTVMIAILLNLYSNRTNVFSSPRY